MLEALPTPKPTSSQARLALRRATVVSPREHSDQQLVAQLLGTTRTGPSPDELASALIVECGGLSGVRRLGVSGLVDFGLIEAQAVRLLGALELGSRALLAELAETRARIGSFESVVDWARPRLAHLEHEEVWLLSLDGANGLIRSERVAQGGLHGCALLPRDVLRPALRNAASAVILVHNHPSGDPSPSPDDVDMTRQLAQAAGVVGTPLLDHIVVARQGARSLLQLGVL